jgi:hypothetical protein
MVGAAVTLTASGCRCWWCPLGPERPPRTATPAYLSAACGASPLPPCPNNVFPCQHDFGSILAFTEHNFNFNPPLIDEPYYADYNAPDWSTDHKTTVPPSDFFPLPLNQPRSFVSIPVPPQFTFTWLSALRSMHWSAVHPYRSR